MKGLLTDVEIPRPVKTLTKVWPNVFQRSNSNVTNTKTLNWALKPIERFDKNQISSIGEVYSLYGHFSFNHVRFEKQYCYQWKLLY